MSHRSKIFARIAVAIAGLVVILAVSAILILRSNWFANYVREKIITTVEDSTGGKVDLKSFSFDWHTLTATVRGFVIHGNEPTGDPPLFQAPLIVLQVKLFKTHLVDLESFRVESPSANVMIFANGDSNIPTPKVVRNSNSQSGLERVVDLAIGHLDISNGSVQFQDRQIAFNAHGGNLLLEWLFDPQTTEYRGGLSMNPLQLATDSNPPLDARLNIPLTIAKHTIHVNNATIQTAQSKISVTGQIQNLAAPDIDGKLIAHLALNDFARSFGLAIHPTPGQAMDISVAAHSDSKAFQIQSASMELGASHLELAGDLRTGADFHGGVSVAEIGELLQLPQQPSGSLEFDGRATLRDSKYSANGTVNATNVAFEESGSRFSNVHFTSAFQVDPGVIAVNNLDLSLLGGRITGSGQIHDLKNLAAAIDLRGFTIRGLASSLTNETVNYGGAISASVNARGNLKNPDVRARLNVAPEAGGVPVSGQIELSYAGSTKEISLDNSHLNLPHTHIALSGETGRQAQIHVTSSSLKDFQPALALVSSSAIPATLDGGELHFDAQLQGPIANPSINGKIAVSKFAVSGRQFDRLAADFQASPSNITLADGTVAHQASVARFSASVGLNHWHPLPQEPLSATLKIPNGELADFVALAGANPSETRGQLTADVRISGTLGNPQGIVQVSVVNGAIRNESFDRIALDAALSDQLVTLRSFEAIAGNSRTDARGTFNHPRDSFENGQIAFHLASSQIQLSQLKTLARWEPGLSGAVDLHADLLASLSTLNGKTKLVPKSVDAGLKATDLRDREQALGNLTATATTQGAAVRTSVEANFAGSTIQWSGITQLTDDYPTTAQASVRSLPIEKVLALVHRESIAAKGILSLNARLAGTLKNPRANVGFDVSRAAIFGEALDRARGSIDFSSQSIEIPSLEIANAAGQVNLHGTFTHPVSSYDSGDIDMHVATSSVQLQRVHAVEQWKPGLHGTAQFTGDLTGKLETNHGTRRVLPSKLVANATLNNLGIGNQSLGGLKLQAQTSGNALAVNMDSDLGKSNIHGSATIALSGNYAAQGKLTFANVTYSGLDGLVNFASVPDNFEAAAAGEADFSGPLRDPSMMSGELRISKLELSSTAGTHGKRIALQNEAPVVAHLDRSTLRIDNAQFTGPSTHIQVNGSAGFSKSANVNLTMNANADLSVVKQFYEGAFAGGTVTVTSTIRGTLDAPIVNGQVQFKNASLQLENWPNGVYHTNGVILLNGRTATIQSLTAESGGGKVNVGGFVGFGGALLNYDVHADARGVRVRYSGASVAANAALNLSGTSKRSVLSGTVTVERFAYSQQSDLGSILSGSGAVPPAQPSGAGFLSETRLNIRVQTAPGLQFQASAAQELAATADLTVVGTLAGPGMLGRITITEGNLLFFGNKYAVNRGSIAFYNAIAVQPIIDIDLQTAVQGVTVDISVTGPIQNLKLSYRSDPPLRFEDIVALLATGRTPPDPTIAAQQRPQPNQGATQMGESALLGQAIANPVSSRLQRVFGVSQFKIAPEFVTGSSIPQARVTLQQQISSSVTFTYSQDLSQTNSQLVRIEWELTPRFSAVATRDENGIFGVDFFYRKQFH